MKDCEGKTARVLCKTCERSPKRKKKISPYAQCLLNVHMLQEAGFRFENDSFSLEFWLDLSFLKRKIAPRGIL